MRYAGLALALVLPLLHACPGDDQGETAATSAATTNAATTAPEPTTSGEGATTGPGGVTTTTSESSGPPADGNDSTTAAGTTPLDACLATCNHLMKCMIQDVPNCGIPCSGVEMMVAGCSDEYVAQQECAAALTCDELQAWVDAMAEPGAHPCEAEDDAYQNCEVGATT